jgi:hypothetical protein
VTSAATATRSRVALLVPVVAAAVLTVTALQLLRQTGDASWQTVWAEDGRVYFTDALDDGFGALFHSYPEYLGILPRLVAFPTPFLPIGDVDLYFAVAGALLTSLIAVGAYWAAGPLVRSTWLRGVLALAVMFHPLTVPAELIGNLTNVIWPLTFLAFLMLLRRPRSTAEAAVASGVCAIAALSQILVVLYLPLAVLLAVRRRSREMWIVVAGLAGGLALQAVPVLVGEESKRFDADYPHLAPLYGIRVVGSAVLGENTLDDAWLRFDYWLLLLVALLAVALGLLAARCQVPVRLAAGACLLYSVAMFVIPVGFRGTQFETLHIGTWIGGASRFAALGVWLLLTGVFVLVDRADVGATLHTALVVVLVVQFALIAVTGFRIDSSRSVGPTWQASLTAAEAECAAEGSPGDDLAVRVQVSPPARHWFARVPCDRITP